MFYKPWEHIKYIINFLFFFFWLFTLFIMPPDEQNVLILMKSNLSVFSFVVNDVCDLLEKYLPFSKSRSLPCCLLALCLTFYSWVFHPSGRDFCVILWQGSKWIFKGRLQWLVILKACCSCSHRYQTLYICSGESIHFRIERWKMFLFFNLGLLWCFNEII